MARRRVVRVDKIVQTHCIHLLLKIKRTNLHLMTWTIQRIILTIYRLYQLILMGRKSGDELRNNTVDIGIEQMFFV